MTENFGKYSFDAETLWPVYGGIETLSALEPILKEHIVLISFEILSFLSFSFSLFLSHPPFLWTLNAELFPCQGCLSGLDLHLISFCKHVANGLCIKGKREQTVFSSEGEANLKKIYGC